MLSGWECSRRRANRVYQTWMAAAPLTGNNGSGAGVLIACTVALLQAAPSPMACSSSSKITPLSTLVPCRHCAMLPSCQPLCNVFTSL